MSNVPSVEHLRKQIEVQKLQIQNLRSEVLRLESERDEALREAQRLYNELYPRLNFSWFSWVVQANVIPAAPG